MDNFSGFFCDIWWFWDIFLYLMFNIFIFFNIVLCIIHIRKLPSPFFNIRCFIYPFYILITVILGLIGNFQWKGRNFKEKG